MDRTEPAYQLAQPFFKLTSWGGVE